MQNAAAPQNRALTVKNPWAHAIIHLGKDVENRSRPTKHRGRLYIHAGKGWSQEGIDFLRSRGQYTAAGEMFTTTGMVIGTVDVIGCHHADECWTGWEGKDGVDQEERCSDWAMADHYHWVLANPQPLAASFPAKGMLGIWKLEVPGA